MLIMAKLFKYLLRIVAVVFILWGLYQAYTIVSSQVVDVREPGFGYFFSRIGYFPFPSLLGFALIFSSLKYIAIGVLLLSFSSFRPNVAYWGFQVTVWLVVVSMWYRKAFLTGGGAYNNLWPFNTGPETVLPWLGIACICSFALFAVSYPLRNLLRRFFTAITMAPTEQSR